MATGGDDNPTCSGQTRKGSPENGDNDVYEPSPGYRVDDTCKGYLETDSDVINDSEITDFDKEIDQTEQEYISQFEEQLRLVLIGKTGVGKSATGNTIIGNVGFKSKASKKSVTTHSQSQERQWEGKQVIVIDTPGLYDTGISMSDVKKELIRCIGMSLPGPHAFLYVMSASSRQTKEEDEAFKEFVKIFGEKVYDFLIIIFVKKDEMENLSFQNFLKEELTDSLLEIVQNVGKEKCFWLNNKNKSSEEEQKTVECILKTASKLNQHSSDFYYTNAMLKRVLRPLTRKFVEFGFKFSANLFRNEIEKGGPLYEYLYAVSISSLGLLIGGTAFKYLSPKKCAIL